MSKDESSNNDVAKLFGSLFIIILLAFGVGYFIESKAQPKLITEKSNGFIFTKSGNFWYTSIKNPIINQEYNVDFRYPPSQVSNVTVEGDPTKFFNLLKLNNLTGAYFTFDPRENLTYVNLAAADLSKFLKVINNVVLVPGCTVNETDACHSRPIITCENQKDKAVVIYVKTSDTAKISMKENCLTIEGQGNDLVKAYTKLLFMWYSII